MIVRNTVTGGRHVGPATTAGVSAAAALQGLRVSFGLAGFIVRAHPVFLAIKWAGIAYLAASALLSAIRGSYPPAEGRHAQTRVSGLPAGICQRNQPQAPGVLPRPVPAVRRANAPWWAWLVHAWTLRTLGTCWCLLIVAGIDRARDGLNRRDIRRMLDALTRTLLLGFCTRLATER